jgi:hypothetical protein
MYLSHCLQDVWPPLRSIHHAVLHGDVSDVCKLLSRGALVDEAQHEVSKADHDCFPLYHTTALFMYPALLATCYNPMQSWGNRFTIGFLAYEVEEAQSRAIHVSTVVFNMQT